MTYIPYITSIKRSEPSFKIYWQFRRLVSCSILTIDYTLSKWPLLNSVYLLAAHKWMSISVFVIAGLIDIYLFYLTKFKGYVVSYRCQNMLFLNWKNLVTISSFLSFHFLDPPFLSKHFTIYPSICHTLKLKFYDDTQGCRNVSEHG